MKFLAIARLDGYSMKLHKKSTDKSAKANIALQAAETVWGVLWQFNKEEKAKLDELEGLGKGYDECEIEVRIGEGTEKCYTYTADPKSIDDSLKPYDWYMEFIVGGAIQHSLPESYVDWLKSISSVIDPDEKRAARERSVLPC